MLSLRRRKALFSKVSVASSFLLFALMAQAAEPLKAGAPILLLAFTVLSISSASTVRPAGCCSIRRKETQHLRCSI